MRLAKAQSLEFSCCEGRAIPSACSAQFNEASAAVKAPAAADAHGTLPTELTLNVLPGLAGGPLSYAREQGVTKDTSWSDFLTIMRAGPWGSRQTVFKIRSVLANLKQGSLPVAEYVKLVDEQLVLLPSASEGEKIFALQRGLVPALHDRSVFDPKGAEWTSYAALCTYICAIGSDTGRGGGGGGGGSTDRPHKRSFASSSNTPQQGPRKAPRPYPARDALSQAEREALRKKGACFKCKQVGHRAEDMLPSGKPACPKHK